MLIVYEVISKDPGKRLCWRFTDFHFNYPIAMPLCCASCACYGLFSVIIALQNVNTFREDSFFELFCKCMFEHDTERMITATVWRTVLMSSMERSGWTRVDDSSRIFRPEISLGNFSLKTLQEINDERLRAGQYHSPRKKRTTVNAFGAFRL